MDDERPIGWWVKRLDALLEEALDSVVAGEGLTRRHWQVLHLLADGVDREGDVHAALADFSGDGHGVLTDLVGRGWVDRPRSGSVHLTADGVAAHDRVLRAVGRVRRHTADGLSREEYERTVHVLARMVGNVERALGRG
jgi:DNA-binding MarR family transcriptional regulator